MKKEFEIISDNKFDYTVKYKGRLITVYLDGCGDPLILVDGEYIDEIHIVRAMKYIDKMEEI